MKNLPSFAVLGAGAGGLATAAHLSLAGFKVNLFELSQFKENIDPIERQGGVELSGVLKTGLAKLNKVTTDVNEAIAETDVVTIAVPAFGHNTIVEALAPHLHNGQIVVFNTGYFACLRFNEKLREKAKGIAIAETTLLAYLAKSTAPGRVNILGLKRTLPIAAFPSKDTGRVVEVMRKAYSQFVPAASVLEISFENINPMVHPAIALLNMGLLERMRPEEEFFFYKDGCTPLIGKVVEALDRERLAVAKALDLGVHSEIEWLSRYYGLRGETVSEALQSGEAQRKFSWSPSVCFRYIREDVPYGLVPIASFGDLLNVPTPSTKAIVQLCSTVDGVDYWHEGTTVEKLRMTGLTPREIVDIATKGRT